MFLILYIPNKNQAVWLVYDQKQIKFQHKFIIEHGRENILLNLDKFSRRCKLNLKSFAGFGLLVEQSGLTQVKILTTIINVLGWQQQKPIAGIYYDVSADNLDKLAKNVMKAKKFHPLKPQYQRQPEITVSKRKNKFKIVK